jgi:hypothetical protein
MTIRETIIGKKLNDPVYRSGHDDALEKVLVALGWEIGLHKSKCKEDMTALEALCAFERLVREKFLYEVLCETV